MVCTSLGSLLRPLFYFLCYIHFSLSVMEERKYITCTTITVLLHAGGRQMNEQTKLGRTRNDDDDDDDADFLDPAGDFHFRN